jgi:rare lipoprotein A
MFHKKSMPFAALALLALVTAMPLAAQSEIIKLEAIASYYGDEFQGRPTSSGELFDMNALTAAHKTLPFGTMLEVTNLANGKKVIVRVNDRGPFVDTRELDVSKAAAAKLGMIETGTARVSIRKIASLDAAAVNAPVAIATANSAAPAASPTPAASIAPTVSPQVAVVEGTQATTAPIASSVTTTVPVATATVPVATNPPGAATQPVQTVSNPVLGEKSAGLNWRIQLGSFSNEENANRLVIRLRKDGFNPAFEKVGALTRVVIAGVADSDLAAARARLDSAGYGQYIVRQETW